MKLIKYKTIPQWKKKEKKDSKDFNGKQVKGSGNHWASPGDVKTEDFLIDSKHTIKKSYSVSLETWNKLAEEALFTFRLPILSLQIQKTELVVLSKEDFLNLIIKKAK